MKQIVSGTILVGFSGAAAVFCAEFLQEKLSAFVSDEVLLWSTIALSSFSVYIAFFTFFNFLHERWIWAWFTKNLSGNWDGELTNLEDGSSRKSSVIIKQTRDTFLITGLNQKDDNPTPYSHWRGVNELSHNEKVIILYEVESAKDKYHFKRGVMSLEIAASSGGLIHGFYFDSAPSNARGPIQLTKKK